MSVKIENDVLVAKFKKKGAELYSLKSKKSGIDYIFHTFPPMFFGSSPILFPIVGRVKNNKYTYKDKEYNMYIHGFASHQEFEVLEKESNKVTFVLYSNKKYQEIYPFEFELYLIYELVDNSLKVSYKVRNISNEKMYFSIGAHPAFLCPIDKNNRNQYYIYFDGVSVLDRSKIEMSSGLLYENHEQIELIDANEVFVGEKGGILPISDDLFAEDALVFENNQTHKISLLMPDKTPYLSVKFTAPVVGIWSLGDKVLPCVCIEPWYGRCDKKDISVSFDKKEWINELDALCEFSSEYFVICDKEV